MPANPRLLCVLWAAALCLSFSAAANATTYYHWHGAGTGGNTATDPSDPTTLWLNRSNWEPVRLPSPDDDVEIVFENLGAVYAETGSARNLYVKASVDNAFLYVRDGDHLDAASLYVGETSRGHVVQTGGTCEASSLNVGRLAEGDTTYELRGGEILASNEFVSAYGGTGLILQSGGRNVVAETLWVSGYGGRNGTYELQAGELNAEEELIGAEPEGILRQTGGLNAAAYLAVDANGRYEFAGGTLRIGKGLLLEGTLDCTGASGRIEAVDAILDLSQGTVSNAQAATLALDGQCLLIVAPGMNPATTFGTYTGTPLLHTAGETLNVPAGGGFKGRGAIADPVETAGTVQAAPGAAIDFNSGVTVTGGRVDLGRGELTVDVADSGISSGELIAKDSYVGRSGTGTFTQTGGTHAVASSLYLGREDGSQGHYQLRAGDLTLGLPEGPSREYIGYYGSGDFSQSGGTNSTYDLLLGGFGPAATGTYTLSDGHLVVGNSMRLGSYGAGQFTQTGGMATVNTIRVYAKNSTTADSFYALAGGEVTAAQETILSGAFTQTGGLNTVGYLDVSRDGRYELTGGDLRITGGMCVNGVLDLGGLPLAIEADGVIVDLTDGTVLGAGNASLHLGPYSLVFVTSAFDPAAVFREYTNAGITHTRGQPLIIGTHQEIRGSGVIAEPLQTAGTIRASEGGHIGLAGQWAIEGGSVDLGGGRLEASRVNCHIAAGTVTARSGRVSEGTITQDGGVLRFTEDLEIEGGTFELHAGELTVGVPGLLQSEVLSSSMTPAHFVQTGGTHVVYGRHTIMGLDEWTEAVYTQTGGSHVVDELWIGDPEAGEGVLGYILSEGQLTVNAEEVIGARGMASFTQTGGTHTVRGSLRVSNPDALWDPSRGTLTLAGGSLECGDLLLGLDGTAMLNLAAGEAHLAVGGCLTLGAGAYLTAVDGAAVHMTGSAFKNQSGEPAALAGLEQLTVIFEGGDDHWATFEVAGKDAGTQRLGFLINFVLGHLAVGGVEPALVRLDDVFTNSTSLADEALYVHDLTIGPGSTLDLNGLAVYYDGAFVNEGLIVDGAPAYVPEPATLALLGLGAMISWRRRP